MKINGRPYRTIWVKEDDKRVVQIIDQRFLPHKFVIEDLTSTREAALAIKEMHVRGAPLIGATAAFGLYLANLEAPEGKAYHAFMESAVQELRATRPTAVDLFYALNRVAAVLKKGRTHKKKTELALCEARKIADESVAACKSIGRNGLALIEKLSRKKKGEPLHILTHCNAGWLACIDYGTATAPIYAAQKKGIDIHVWVDETRPRNQGARLTAYELLQQGVPHTVITDNTGGHLMQHGMVDLVIVGSDRTTRRGDVANKIGTYLKALAAKDNRVPFYVALPSSSIDWELSDGLKEIPIEERSPDEVRYVQGMINGRIQKVLIPPVNSPAVNYGFDVTPARLVSGLITERGICKASEKGLLELFPEK